MLTEGLGRETGVSARFWRVNTKSWFPPKLCKTQSAALAALPLRGPVARHDPPTCHWTIDIDKLRIPSQIERRRRPPVRLCVLAIAVAGLAFSPATLATWQKKISSNRAANAGFIQHKKKKPKAYSPAQGHEVREFRKGKDLFPKSLPPPAPPPPEGAADHPNTPNTQQCSALPFCLHAP